MKPQKLLPDLCRSLTISSAQLQQLASDFHADLKNCLHGRPAPFKMLPSYLSVPDGQETGLYLALDFGGTNVRVLLVELAGNGEFTVLQHAARPLKAADNSYNFIGADANAEELFDFIAQLVASVIKPEQAYALGHTFSFGLKQSSVNSGILLEWTKEIKTSGVVGQEITALLAAALRRQGLTKIHPAAIINDTVGTLLTAAYSRPHTHAASICGTGHNTAYLEPHHPLTGAPMIINIESGNFSRLPYAAVDDTLDAASENPGAQRLEKMVSGQYLGELLRLLLLELTAIYPPVSSPPAALTIPYSLSGADLGLLLSDSSKSLAGINTWLIHKLALSDTSLEDRQAIQTLARHLADRSARLAAATYLGILQHIDPLLQEPHHIAVDGSLYAKLPGYAQTINAALAELCPHARISTSLSSDGSGIGAALAAHMSHKAGQ